MPLEGDAPFRYLRLREPPYAEAQLAGGPSGSRRSSTAGKRLFAYFKHEDEPTAPRSRDDCSAAADPELDAACSAARR